MTNTLDTIIFKDKKFSDLLEEIHDNHDQKQAQINSLIAELRPLASEVGDAMMVVPMIKEYFVASVKNDEQLVKMASIVQKAITADTKDDGDGGGISEEEKQQLFESLGNIKSNI